MTNYQMNMMCEISPTFRKAMRAMTLCDSIQAVLTDKPEGMRVGEIAKAVGASQQSVTNWLRSLTASAITKRTERGTETIEISYYNWRGPSHEWGWRTKTKEVPIAFYSLA